MAHFLEAAMLVCFGFSWPMNVYKNYKAGTAKSMSIQFILLIITGYVAGITAKLWSHTINYVLAVYIINLAIVSVNVFVYIRNRRLDRLAEGDVVKAEESGAATIEEIDDKLLPEDGELKVVTKAQPTAKQMEDLMLAWKIVKHAKSNGIAIAKDHQSLGIGPGQVNRIWSTQMAIERSGDKVRGAALASDAFFPFDDCVKACAEAGISCIIQPGGSVRDQDSIDACDRYGIAMVFTGMRHFKH